MKAFLAICIILILFLSIRWSDDSTQKPVSTKPEDIDMPTWHSNLVSDVKVARAVSWMRSGRSKRWARHDAIIAEIERDDELKEAVKEAILSDMEKDAIYRVLVAD